MADWDISRRDLFKLGAAAGATLVLGGGAGNAILQAAPAPLDSAKLTKYVDSLPIMPLAKPTGTLNGEPLYTVRMTQFRQRLHKNLRPTPVWGYNGVYPGPTFDVQSNQTIHVKWTNNLPQRHLFQDAIDPEVHGTQPGVPYVRTVVHLHGGHTEAASDGYPEYWYTPKPHAQPNGLGGPKGNYTVSDYPNTQQATLLWYHDHALGATRLNVGAGLAGAYIIRDANEASLNLPSGNYEIPLLIQDRMFNSNGTLLYPLQGPVPRTWVLPDGTAVPANTPGALPVPKIWIPEFFGDTMLVNGKVWPYLTVEPRKYRFRLLNACSSRFLNLQVDQANLTQVPFQQIGSDGGLLAGPVTLTTLLVGPAERADLVIDFSTLANQTITMRNTAAAPYPGGGDVNDPGSNPDVAEIMQFRVLGAVTSPDTSTVPAVLNPTLATRIPESDAVLTRNVILAELDHPVTGDPVMGQLGDLVAGVGTPLLWSDPPTQTPTTDTTEIWNIWNLSPDAHPIHIHLTEFQILDRQNLVVDPVSGVGTPVLAPGSVPVPPAPNEMGWKDTVRVDFATLTRVIAPFRTFSGKYVWHCHIIEHEDNEMMRPMLVLPADDGG